MRYRQLGSTGLFVSELCLGTMTFGGATGWWKQVGSLDQRQADSIVHHALEQGINFIDTADNYAEGVGESMVGAALKASGVRRSDVIVATKVFNPTGLGPNDRGLSRVHIVDSLKRSLDRLQLDHVDLYQLHGYDHLAPLEETLRALDDLTSQGLIHYVGCSNWAAWRMMKAFAVGDRLGYARLSMVQAYYSMAGRDIEREIVPFLEEEKVGLVVWSPLAGGLLSGKFGPGAPDDPDIGSARRSQTAAPRVDIDRAYACIAVMRDIAAALDVTVAQVALAWVLARPYVSSVTIGVKTVSQLDENIRAAALTLSETMLADLDAVSELPPEYPGWSLARQRGVRMPPEEVISALRRP